MIGRTARDEENAFADAFLVSDESSCVSGQNTVVDGGFTGWRGVVEGARFVGQGLQESVVPSSSIPRSPCWSSTRRVCASCWSARLMSCSLLSKIVLMGRSWCTSRPALSRCGARRVVPVVWCPGVGEGGRGGGAGGSGVLRAAGMAGVAQAPIGSL